MSAPRSLWGPDQRAVLAVNLLLLLVIGYVIVSRVGKPLVTSDRNERRTAVRHVLSDIVTAMYERSGEQNSRTFPLFDSQSPPAWWSKSPFRMAIPAGLVVETNAEVALRSGASDGRTPKGLLVARGRCVRLAWAVGEVRFP